jgi:hypothetical protein
VDGRFDDDDYEYDFTRTAPPPDLDKDKLKQMLWFIFASGKDFQLGKDGEYTSSDPNQDATGEVLDLWSLGVVRMPEKPGDAWEKTFRTKRVQKDNKGWFEVVQKSKREHDAIVSRFSGKLVLPKDAPKDPNLDKSDNACEGESRVVFEGGRPVSWESKGKVRFYGKGTDPNSGDDYELEIVLTVESKVTPRK